MCPDPVAQLPKLPTTNRTFAKVEHAIVENSVVCVNICAQCAGCNEGREVSEL